MKESFPTKKNMNTAKRKKNSCTPSTMEMCQQCFGAKKIYDGEYFVICNLCKGKGEVNEDTNNHFIGDLTEGFLDPE